MDYSEQVERLVEEDAGFSELVKKLESFKGEKPKVLLFSHHDLDGVTSAAILKRVLESYLEAEVTVEIPFGFRLEHEEVEDVLAQDDFDVFIVSDKGTFSYYDDFTEYVDEVLIIDHHFKDGMPEDCVVFNPSAVNEVRTSTSLLSHMLATQLEVADLYDDFIALLGGRGDYVIVPGSEQFPELVTPFLDSVRERFGYLFEKKDERLTLFDSGGEEGTALLNQIGEVFHVATLSHLYTPVSEEVQIDEGPKFAMNVLMGFAEQEKSLDFEDLDGFFSKIPKSQQVSEVFELFRKDWEMLEERVKNAVFLEEVKGIGLYLVFSREAPAMEGVSFPAVLPYVASSYLEDFKKRGSHDGSLAVIFCPKEVGTHISLRGGDGVLSCDTICRRMVERVQQERPESKDNVFGGGHEAAAECVAEKSIKIYLVMRELVNTLQELKEKPEKFIASD